MYICLCMCFCVHACVYIHVYMCLCIYTCIHVHVIMCIRICVHMFMCICMCVCLCVSVAGCLTRDSLPTSLFQLGRHVSSWRTACSGGLGFNSCYREFEICWRQRRRFQQDHYKYLEVHENHSQPLLPSVWTFLLLSHKTKMAESLRLQGPSAAFSDLIGGSSWCGFLLLVGIEV